jgi:uncharacterized protein (TIGR03790 family)
MMKQWVVLAVLAAWSFGARALGPENLLLVVNKNVPEGRTLAEFYASKRGVPAGRIVELDLPAGAEEIAADQYDSAVVPVVRAFLRDKALGAQVTCLVTFYGVPLKVAGRAKGAAAQAAEDAALDSELALLRWQNYNRAGPMVNPLRSGIPADVRGKLPPVMMTMRLDAPGPQTVRQMIEASLRAEAEGLHGTMVVDAGGNALLDRKNPNYAAFDRTLRELADVARAKGSLPVILDGQPGVLPAGSQKGVALYCGWYSLQKYVPACAFVPGAVGYHIASYELTTLRNEKSTEWVTGLLNDGVVATLGAVNEPFLSAFPRPDDFFPLLMTGRLPLAEVYWKTTPTMSWRIAMIGDPLYTPFKPKPAMSVDGLPERLRGAVEAEASDNH